MDCNAHKVMQECGAAEAPKLGPIADAARQQMQGRATMLAGALRHHTGDNASSTADDDIVRLDGWARLLPVRVHAVRGTAFTLLHQMHRKPAL